MVFLPRLLVFENDFLKLLSTVILHIDYSIVSFNDNYIRRLHNVFLAYRLEH
jgi:hypothetical protein